MFYIACSEHWTTTPEGGLRCAGTLTESGNPALTADDYAELKDQTIILFAVVFGFLVLKKALF